MTPDERALLQAILDQPDDDTVRLVYADFLEEQGEAARADFIRVQVELVRLTGNSLRRQELEGRREQLWWVAHREDWVQYLGLAMTWESALTLFRRRLIEAAGWYRGRNAQSLRTPTLEPASLVGHQVLWADGQPFYRSGSTGEREVTVTDLANRRAKLLAEHGLAGQVGDRELAGGRLLLFDPDGTLSDGAAAADSDSFFDGDNLPAWDTWVWYAEDRNLQDCGWTPFASYLVAWVPPQVVELADRGIRVNPEECIRWASDVDTVLTRRLRGVGLLR